MRLGLSFSLMTCLLLLGCATGGPSTDKLDRTLFAYAGAVRWGDIDGAASFIDPKILATKPLTDLERQRFEHVQVAGYNVRSKQQPKPDEVQQTVELRLVNRHTQVERGVIDRQLWRWDSEAKRWWLVSGLPDIGQR
jgi:hypothetical protein